jgi:hypothetical protein
MLRRPWTLSEGLSMREAIRAVKPYVARQAYHAIRADLAKAAAPA